MSIKFSFTFNKIFLKGNLSTNDHTYWRRVRITFTHHNVFHFLEVDRTQSMAENNKKIKQYELLSPAIEKQYKHKPVLVFYTTTESRREILNQYCTDVGMLYIFFTKEDLR